MFTYFKFKVVFIMNSYSCILYLINIKLLLSSTVEKVYNGNHLCKLFIHYFTDLHFYHLYELYLLHIEAIIIYKQIHLRNTGIKIRECGSKLAKNCPFEKKKIKKISILIITIFK